MALGLFLLGLGAWLAGPQGTTAAQTATPEPCPPATPASGTTTPEQCLLIGEYDIYCKPNVITIPADTAVRVVTSNRGEATYNFSITDHENPDVENLDISVTTDSGETGETTIDAPAGTYYFFCDQPGHEGAGMRGYLTVEADAARRRPSRRRSGSARRQLSVRTRPGGAEPPGRVARSVPVSGTGAGSRRQA